MGESEIKMNFYTDKSYHNKPPFKICERGFILFTF